MAVSNGVYLNRPVVLATALAASLGVLGCKANQPAAKVNRPSTYVPELVIGKDMEGNVCGKTLDWGKDPLKGWRENPSFRFNRDLDGAFKVKVRASQANAGASIIADICPTPAEPNRCWPQFSGTVDKDGNLVTDGSKQEPSSWDTHLGIRLGNEGKHTVRFFKGSTSTPSFCTVAFDTLTK